jgi:hypothetical protein
MVGITSEKGTDARRLNGRKGGRPVGSTVSPEEKAVRKSLQEMCLELEPEAIEVLRQILLGEKYPANARLLAVSHVFDRARGKAVQPELHGGEVILQVVTGVPDPDPSCDDYIPKAPGGVVIVQHTPAREHNSPPGPSGVAADDLFSSAEPLSVSHVIRSSDLGAEAVPTSFPPPDTPAPPPPGDMTADEVRLLRSHERERTKALLAMEREAELLKQARDAEQDAMLGVKFDWSRG